MSTAELNPEAFKRVERTLSKALKELIEIADGDPSILDSFELIKANKSTPDENHPSGKGSALRQIRRKLGYSQEQLGLLLGVTIQTISRWERGESAPSQHRPIQLFNDSKNFTEVVTAAEVKLPSQRKLYNDFLTAIARPIELTRYLYEYVDFPEQIVAHICQLNELRMKKAREYLDKFEYYHLFDKSLVERYIKAGTIPEHTPGQTIPSKLLKKFIENQLQLCEQYENYHMAMTEKKLDYNFSVMEGIRNKVAWVEVREHLVESKGTLYAIFVDGEKLVDELDNVFNDIWVGRDTVLRDETAVNWLERLLEDIS